MINGSCLVGTPSRRRPHWQIRWPGAGESLAGVGRELECGALSKDRELASRVRSQCPCIRVAPDYPSGGDSGQGSVRAQ
jgi:hypothetical protein